MSIFNETITSLETKVKLRNNINDELVNVTLYKQIIGSIIYLCNIIPDIYQSVTLLSRFMERPQESNGKVVTRVFQYIKGTIDHGVLIPRLKTSLDRAEVHVYVDSDFNRDQDKRKSTAGYIFMFGGAPISWSSRKQGIMVLSSCEAQYVVASYADCQPLWIKMLLGELKVIGPKKMKLFVDNKFIIDLSDHHMCHEKSKHIKRSYVL
ncbi:secreted RxLR effector protein 161-like [Lathyrus oleraceus]|uniref:secreted RxLR effector protein 161-like n=1 Tax=Pisum sativum TaxID=3888 RepID=UPI0021D32362|nr:secreted RxLR effector protein 161-like [Pisum sativum]